MGQRIGRVQWGSLMMGPGSRYHIASISGIDDMPAIDGSDMDREDQHGEFTGPDYTKARVVQIGLSLRGDTPDGLRTLVTGLRSAIQPMPQPAALQLLDWELLLWAKPRRRDAPYDATGLWRTGSAALEFYCADPYLYSLTEHTVSTVAYSPSAGRTYNLTFNRVYGSAGEAGRVQPTNAGAAPVYPRLRIDGPVADPIVEQVNTSSTLTIDATLQAGEWLEIDTRTRAVLLQGSTPRRGWVRAGSRWPILQPGPNEIAYRGATLPGAPDQPSLLTVTWRDASL